MIGWCPLEWLCFKVNLWVVYLLCLHPGERFLRVNILCHGLTVRSIFHLDVPGLTPGSNPIRIRSLNKWECAGVDAQMITSTGRIGIAKIIQNLVLVGEFPERSILCDTLHCTHTWNRSGDTVQPSSGARNPFRMSIESRILNKNRFSREYNLIVIIFTPG